MFWGSCLWTNRIIKFPASLRIFYLRPETLRLGGGAQEFVSERGPQPHVRPLSGRTGPGGKWSMHGMTAALSTPPRGHGLVKDENKSSGVADQSTVLQISVVLILER